MELQHETALWHWVDQYTPADLLAWEWDWLASWDSWRVPVVRQSDRYFTFHSADFYKSRGGK